MGMLDNYVISGNTNIINRLMGQLKLAPGFGGQNNTMLSRIVIPVIPINNSQLDIQTKTVSMPTPGTGAGDYQLLPINSPQQGEIWDILCMQFLATLATTTSDGIFISNGIFNTGCNLYTPVTAQGWGTIFTQPIRLVYPEALVVSLAADTVATTFQIVFKYNRIPIPS